MSQTKHTPGPWNIHRHDEFSVMGPHKEKIAQVLTVSITATVAEEKANARLIAAAPELAFVVRMVADTYEAEQTRGNFPSGQTWHTIDHATGQTARAAIAKAEGRA